MIDAINVSTHDGRFKNSIYHTGGFSKVMKSDFNLGNTTPAKLKSSVHNNLVSLLLVSGMIGTLNFVTDSLISIKDISAHDYSQLKTITKHSGIWALIGGGFFGFFKIIEKIALKQQ